MNNYRRRWLMKYEKYQHIEKLGREECEGILDSSKVYCFSKIDGTNGCLYLDEEGNLKAGSRNRALALDDDNHKFYATALEHPEYLAYLKKHPNRIIYGEWLVKHTIRTYADDAWNKFYVFDVFEVDLDEESGRYLSYDEYAQELDEFNIEYIPVLAILDHPSTEDVLALAKENHYLIPCEENIGEGIVVKTYDYRNKYGRQTWGKLVAAEFLETKQKLRKKNHEIKGVFEAKAAYDYITDAVIKKEYAKVLNEHPDAKQQELIGRVLNAVYEAFLTEDLVTVVKKNKGCSIDFRAMRKQSDLRVKDVLADKLF
jgi:hypothetical protein